MERIIQIVTEKSEGKTVPRFGGSSRLLRYINTCCDLLFDDDWTSYGVSKT